MTISYRTGLLLLASGVLQACVLVPFPVVPEKDEFESGSISWIRPGESTRLNVVEQLGDPVVVRKGGNLAIYGQSRTVAGWFFGAFWGSGGTMPIERKSMLMIDYDSRGIVSKVYVLRGEKSCIESGVCVEAEFELYETGKLMEHESTLVTAVVYDSDNKTRPEQQFNRKHRFCGVYLYSSGVDEFLQVKNPQLGTTSIVHRGYIYWETEPGAVTLQASRQVTWNSFVFECPANQLRFVSLFVDRGAHWNSPKITVESEEIGKAQVLARSLILQ